MALRQGGYSACEGVKAKFSQRRSTISAMPQWAEYNSKSLAEAAYLRGCLNAILDPPV